MNFQIYLSSLVPYFTRSESFFSCLILRVTFRFTLHRTSVTLYRNEVRVLPSTPQIDLATPHLRL